ncbi:hypothetical protein ABE51_30105 [Bacillus thuringiensis]|nr:hypothetical protein [Bacillus thuringiensis]
MLIPTQLLITTIPEALLLSQSNLFCILTLRIKMKRLCEALWLRQVTPQRNKDLGERQPREVLELPYKQPPINLPHPFESGTINTYLQLLLYSK